MRQEIGKYNLLTTKLDSTLLYLDDPLSSVSWRQTLYRWGLAGGSGASRQGLLKQRKAARVAECGAARCVAERVAANVNSHILPTLLAGLLTGPNRSKV